MKIITGLILCAIFSAAGAVQAQTGNLNRDEAAGAQLFAQLNKSVVGRQLYNDIQANEKLKWHLQSAAYFIPISPAFSASPGILPGDHLNGLFLVFNHRKNELWISVDEHQSIEGARSLLTMPVSQGKISDYKNYGDEGRKITSFDSGFSNLQFRKGKFYVSVACRGREDIADRFAGYIAAAIEPLPAAGR